MVKVTRRWSPRQARAIVATAVLVAFAMAAQVLGSSPAHAQGSDVTIGLAPVDPGVPTSITIDPTTGQIVDVTGLLVDDVPGQCIDLPDGYKTCVGNPGMPKVEGEASTERLFIDADVDAALGWLADEGVRAVAAQYHVPADDRVEQYARDEVRAYVMNRLLDILDKASYSIALTPNEQKALAFLQNEVLTADRSLATAAYGEYVRFSNEKCGYVPPPAPAFVSTPVTLPDSVQSGCRGAIGVGSVFSPPVPSVEHFQAWGLYRVADDLGLTSLSNADVQEGIAHLIRAGVLGAGIGAATGAAMITYALVGGNVALATAIAGVLAKGSTTLLFGGAFSVAFGAAAAAGIVLIVLLSAVAIGLSVWQFVETEQIGSTLSARKAAAEATTDPFGIYELRVANIGRSLDADLLTWTTEESRPAYRRQNAVARLSEYVTRWSMVRGSGTVRSDVDGIWPANATTTDDYRFRVTDGEGDVTTTDHITVVTPGGGEALVRFTDGWFAVESGGTTRAELDLEYVDDAGNASYLVRQPVPGTVDEQQVVVTRPSLGTSVQQGSFAFQLPGGGTATAEILPPAGTAEGVARPSVIGTMLPDRVHRLRPNAINTAGQLDDATFAQDYDVTWTVERFDEGSRTWIAEAVTPEAAFDNPTYGATFTPGQPGRYRAAVTLVHRDGLYADVTGTVELAVVPPPIEVVSLEVTDDPVANELQVAVQVTEPAEGDDITVEVSWPGTVDSDDPGPTTSTTVPCLGAYPCGTAIATLTHPIQPLTDLDGDVAVTITNGYGSSVTRIVPIDVPARPSFVEPPVAPPEGQAGVVSFAEHVVHVQVPAGVGGENYVLAGIVPGGGAVDAGFIITDPTNPGPPLVAVDVHDDGRFLLSVEDEGGQPVLNLNTAARMEDLGIIDVPILIQQQDNLARRGILVRIDVVPAPNDLYRAGVFTDVDPLNFLVDGPPEAEVRLLGGKDEWGAYEGEVCIGLSQGLSSPQHCAPKDELFEVDGTPRPFAYHRLAPHGLEPGSFTIRAWLPEDPRTFTEPSEVAFVVAPGSAAPTITELTWNPVAKNATLAVTPGSAPIEAVRCSIAGAPLPDCFESAGGTWSPPPLPPGPVAIDVVVLDENGNYDSGVLSFEVVGPTLPVATPANIEVLEGHQGTTLLRIPVTLSKPAVNAVQVDYATTVVSGSEYPQGTPSTDYAAKSGTLVFTPGVTVANIDITVYGDVELEQDELVVVGLKNPSGVTLGGFWGLSISTIVDDDWPKVVPGSVEVAEGEGEVVALVPVVLSKPSVESVTVSWETYPSGTLAGEATAVDDYAPAAGTMVFAPGQTAAFVPVTVHPDALDEPDELILIRFHSPSGARLGGFFGIGLVRILGGG